MTPFEVLRHAAEYKVFYWVHILCAVWIGIEALLSVFKGFAAVYFVRTFLGDKKSRKFLNRVNILYSLLYAILFSTEYFFFGIFKNIGLILLSIPLTALLILFAFRQCKGKTPLKIAAPVISSCVIIPITAVCNITTVKLANTTNVALYLFMHDVKTSWAILLVSTSLIYFSLYVILLMAGKTDVTGKKSLFQWGIISAALTVSVILALRTFRLYCNDLQNLPKLTLCITIAAADFILSDIFVFLLLSAIIKRNKAVNELNLLRQTEEYNRQFAEHMQSEYETLKKLRHDCKNSYIALSALLENGETEKAAEQLKEYLGDISASEVFINTDSPIVNAVANAKLSEAKSLGIDCSCLVDKNISGIDGADLCSLLSNMLDNAVTACKNDPSPSKRLHLSIISDGGGYIFTVRNTVPEPVLEKNPELKSSKESPSEHGCGVRIIKSIAEKYGGSSDFYDEDGMFCCSVVVRGR